MRFGTFAGLLFFALTRPLLASQFLIFSSPEEAQRQYQEYLNKTEQDLKILELNASEYIYVRHALKEIFTAFDFAGPVPEFLILENSQTSFTMGEPGGQRPYLLLIAKAAVKQPGFYFTLAHELSHLIRQRPAPVRQFKSDHDEALWEKWYNLMRLTGLNHLPELDSVPLADLYDNEFAVFPQMLDSLINACPAAKLKMQKAKSLLGKAQFSALTNDYSQVPAGLAAVTRDFKVEAQKCWSQAKPDDFLFLQEFTEVVMRGKFESAEKFKLAAQNDEQVMGLVSYFKSIMGKKNFALNFWKNLKKLTAEKLKIETELRNKNIQFSTAEDFADIEAVKVLYKLGKPIETNFTPQGLSREEEALCRQMIKDARPVSYGSYASLHHSPCWRLKRNLEQEFLLRVDELR